jgi:regulatory protein
VSLAYRGREAARLRDGAAIEALEVGPADPNLRRVVAGGRHVATLWARDAERLGLAVGGPWSSALASRVRELVEASAARDAALRLLGGRAMSRGELLERLGRRGHARAACAAALEQLIQDGWLDEASYARALCAELLRRQPAGEPFLVRRLTARHIDPDLARQAALEALAGRDPVEEAVRFGRARLPPASLARAARARRLAGLLARRGFDEETVGTALDKLGFGGGGGCDDGSRGSP